MQAVNRYNDLLRNSKNDPSKVPEIVRSAAEQGQKVVDAFETRAKQRLQDAKAEVTRYEDIFINQGRGSKSEKTAPTSKADPYDIMDILKSEPPAKAAPANAPAAAPASAKPSTSRTGDASSANPYVDAKGKPIPNAPRGEASAVSRAIDAAPGVARDVASKVNETLNSAELRYLQDKIARKEKLSVTDRIRAERAGLI
jgi:hypothetical protein